MGDVTSDTRTTIAKHLPSRVSSALEQVLSGRRTVSKRFRLEPAGCERTVFDLADGQLGSKVSGSKEASMGLTR